MLDDKHNVKGNTQNSKDQFDWVAGNTRIVLCEIRIEEKLGERESTASEVLLHLVCLYKEKNEDRVVVRV